MVYHLWETITMLEYNPIPTNKSQHKEGAIKHKVSFLNVRYKNLQKVAVINVSKGNFQ